MRFKSRFQAIMAIGTAISLTVMTVCFFMRNIGFFYSLGITALTFFTHFMIRYLGAMIASVLPKKLKDPNRRWYQPKKWEKALYRKLGVKRLKDHVPTYDPDQFDFKKRTPAELLYASCHAEVTHELIVVMSFLPMLYTLKFGSFQIFLITSLLAACVDLFFVIVQRYNRPRFIRYARNDRNINT